MDKDITLYRASRLINYLASAIGFVLLFRFILKLLGANPGALFTDFIYTLSAPFVAPFSYVFAPSSIVGNVFEWSTLLAIAMYWLVAQGIIQLLAMSRTVSKETANQSLRFEENS